MVGIYDQSKSTLPEHQPSLSSAVRVKNLHYFDDRSDPSRPWTRPFSHVRHIVTALSCCDGLLASIPMLDQLPSLSIDGLVGESAHAKLQIILDRASRLHQLILKDWKQFGMKLLELNSRTTRELIAYGNDLKHQCFNREQCVTLATFSLGQQCELLDVGLEHSRLRCWTPQSFTQFACIEIRMPRHSDTRRLFGSDGTKLHNWLENHFPNVSWHVQRPYNSVLVDRWIRWSINENQLDFFHYWIVFAGVQCDKQEQS